MRKLYALLTGFLLTLVTPDVTAQNESANFISDVTGGNVHFTNTSTTNTNDTSLRRCQWQFGDGSSLLTYYNTDPNHVYTQSGTYQVCLKLLKRIVPTTVNGDTLMLVSYVCKPVVITVPDSCRVYFETGAVTNTLSGRVFKAIPWHNNQKKPESICWNFGDGHDTCINYNPNEPPPPNGYSVYHVYGQPGTYNVCLKIRYQGGCETYYCHTVQIAEQDSCTADFESPATSPAPLGKYFIAHPWHNQNKKPLKVCWNFGDGRDTCIQYSTTYTGAYAVYHLYSQPGVYNVCVNILYDRGCESKSCHEIKVSDEERCSADFQRLPITAYTSALHASFQALAWNSHNNKPAKICWSFGDGSDTCIEYSNTNTEPYTVNHNYADYGSYEVCIKIIYFGGCEAKNCKIIQTGRPDSCSADFERIPVLSTNNTLKVYYKALPWNNNYKKPARICWIFGDGTDTCISYLNLFTGTYAVAHTYQLPGLYEACVKIFYYGGCEAKKCKSVQIGERDSCSADFEKISVTASTPLTAGFRALPWNSNNRMPENICWSFGDSHDTCIKYNAIDQANYIITHTYTHAGLYNVCVRILYQGGCLVYKCKSLQIGEPADSCGADFEMGTIGTSPLTPHFTAIPHHNNNKKPAYICWRFGDGRDTCIQYDNTYPGPYGVNHTYNTPGQYEVCIRIVYNGGCEAKKCKLIIIPPVLHDTCAIKLFEITPSITSLVRGFYASLSSIPNRRPERICWYFGDGSDTCINIDPQSPLPDFIIRHTYPAPGVYKACVKVLFHEGCIAYDCREVVIRGTSNVCGGYMIDSLTAPRSFKFKGFSIHNPNDQVVSYRWTFGDGITDIGKEVTHTYFQGGDYEVCLYIKTQLGCETRICKKVRVPGNNEPALRLTPNPVITALHVAFFSTHTEQVSIKILNAMGVPIRAYIRNVTVGANNWDFDLAILLPGIYSFVVQSPNQLASAIFLKQ